MQPRAAEPDTTQAELPFDAPERAGGGGRPVQHLPPRVKRARQPTATDARPDPAAPTASHRATRSVGRPLQPVPRLLLSRKEAAASLGVSLDTFERRVQPVIKLVPCGQLVLVPLSELERWCDDHAHYLAGAV
jgi:hypothetical protein